MIKPRRHEPGSPPPLEPNADEVDREFEKLRRRAHQSGNADIAELLLFVILFTLLGVAGGIVVPRHQPDILALICAVGFFVLVLFGVRLKRRG